MHLFVLPVLLVKTKLTYLLSVFVDLFHAFVEYANAVVASAAKNVNLTTHY